MAKITVTGPTGVGGEIEVDDGARIVISEEGEISAFGAGGSSLPVTGVSMIGSAGAAVQDDSPGAGAQDEQSTADAGTGEGSEEPTTNA